MTIECARAVLAEVGGDPEAVRWLADGMSSSAWTDGDRVVRLPAPGAARRPPRYAAEAEIGARLVAAGVPAVDWTVRRVDGVAATVGPLRSGRPVTPPDWTAGLVTAVAEALHTAHRLSDRGWGPVGDDASLVGRSSDMAAGVVDRYWLARSWPFDGASLTGHPIASIAPDRVASLEARVGDIRAAAAVEPGLLHTDLHPDHLLVDGGHLTGLLDFGEAWIGSVAWDLACVRYYHGEEVARLVAHAYPVGDGLREPAALLGLSFALYKIAKTPERADVIERALGML